MSKLQHDAATTIQREFRFYRRRRINLNCRNQRLIKQAQDFLDVFLRQETASLVPVCLLEALRETRVQETAITRRREDLAASLTGDVYVSLVNESIRDVFHDVLQAMVKSYRAQQNDLSRAAIPTTVAVATDILSDWTKELVAELLSEALVESAMMSMFSDLDLALDASGAVVSNANGGRSAAKDLLASKNAEKQAEAELAAAHEFKKQQQKQQQIQKKEKPVTALGQAIDLFDKEMDERDSFMSRNTKRRQKGSKKTRGGTSTPSRGRRQRHDKYKRV
ncbi:hypothetical protein PInf_007661 [Phytophthora infestans]|nr:hypothetical protein PInf_007661 [Phytophthora infestans]